MKKIWMKKKSTFSSKEITSKTKKNIPSRSKVSWVKNSIFENQEVKQDLQSFYDKEAKKYSETRKKFWHEEIAILDEISPLFWLNQPLSPSDSSPNMEQNSESNFPLCEERGTACGEEVNKKLRILEFWCGSGRFATLLNQNFSDKFDYVGIDLSDELLSYASKDNPNLTFFQWDITKLVKNFEQESFDLIVWTSSFQHIPTNKERSFLMKNFYRLLDYDWILLMTNRSLSKWFMKKHRKTILKSRFLSLIQFDKSKSRDIMVPRTDEGWKIYERFYHFFSLKELEKLAIFSGLNIKTNTYINDSGEFTDDEKISRSSLFVAQKSPIIN